MTREKSTNKVLKFFIVENHQETLDALRMFLEAQGHEVDSAVDFKSGLRIGLTSEFDVFLCDIGLSDSDGWTLMKRLSELKPIRGIAVSGYGMRGDIEKSKSVGFIAHIVKPFGPHAFEAALKQALNAPPTKPIYEGTEREEEIQRALASLSLQTPPPDRLERELEELHRMVNIETDEAELKNLKNQIQDVEEKLRMGRRNEVAGKFQNLSGSTREEHSETSHPNPQAQPCNSRRETDTQRDVNALAQSMEKAESQFRWTGEDLYFRRSADRDEMCLNVLAYADVLARLFRLNVPGEFSLAIFGHWGRGKTFLMERTEEAINNQELVGKLIAEESAAQSRGDTPGRLVTGLFETVFFSAWRYPSRPEVWIHLYESIFQKLRSKGWWGSLAHIVRAGLIRHGAGKLFGVWLALWFAAVPKAWLIRDLGNYFHALDSSVAVGSVIFALFFLHKFWKTKDVLEGAFLKAPRHSEKLGLQSTIGEDLSALLRGWIDVQPSPRVWPVFWVFVGILIATILIRAGDARALGLVLCACVAIPAAAVQFAFATSSQSPTRLLLVVDDLDRCPFDHLLSVVESIKLLVEKEEIHKRVRVAILVEEDVLKHAIWKKYSQLTEERAAKAIGTEYTVARIFQENCEKLFTAHLRLAALTPDEIGEVVRTFAKPKSKDLGATLEKQTVATPKSAANEPTIADTQSPKSEVAGAIEPDGSRATSVENIPEANPSLALSTDEKAILRDELNAAKERLKAGLGPRAIRAFLFRYQLARLILEEVGTPIRQKNEIAELTRLLATKCLFGERIDQANSSKHLKAVVNQVA